MMPLRLGYLDRLGYVFVPDTCAAKSAACRVHVAFHGCHMSADEGGEAFVEHAG